MSKGAKIAIVIVVVIIVLTIVGWVLVKYTTVGMSYRISRLHEQIEKRYGELKEIYAVEEAKQVLVEELLHNHLVQSARFSGDKLVLCYPDQSCEDYYVGVED
jgi:cell division protein FtsL